LPIVLRFITECQARDRTELHADWPPGSAGTEVALDGDVESGVELGDPPLAGIPALHAAHAQMVKNDDGSCVRIPGHRVGRAGCNARGILTLVADGRRDRVLRLELVKVYVEAGQARAGDALVEDGAHQLTYTAGATGLGVKDQASFGRGEFGDGRASGIVAGHAGFFLLLHDATVL